MHLFRIAEVTMLKGKVILSTLCLVTMLGLTACGGNTRNNNASDEAGNTATENDMNNNNTTNNGAMDNNTTNDNGMNGNGTTNNDTMNNGDNIIEDAGNTVGNAVEDVGDVTGDVVEGAGDVVGGAVKDITGNDNNNTTTNPNTALEYALCEKVTTSSIPAKITSWSPTIVPPLTEEIPISFSDLFCLT